MPLIEPGRVLKWNGKNAMTSTEALLRSGVQKSFDPLHGGVWRSEAYGHGQTCAVKAILPVVTAGDQMETPSAVLQHLMGDGMEFRKRIEHAESEIGKLRVDEQGKIDAEAAGMTCTPHASAGTWECKPFLDEARVSRRAGAGNSGDGDSLRSWASPEGNGVCMNSNRAESRNPTFHRCVKRKRFRLLRSMFTPLEVTIASVGLAKQWSANYLRLDGECVVSVPLWALSPMRTDVLLSTTPGDHSQSVTRLQRFKTRGLT
jgi:hypothetical protein